MGLEVPANGAQTTISSSITSSATTCALTTATAFLNGQYRCLITDGTNYEIVLATALSGSTLTIVRAAETWNGAATAYGFAGGSTITCVLTVQSAVNLTASLAELTHTNTNYTINSTTMTAIDSTNLTLSFVVPYSGNVRLKFDGVMGMGTAADYVSVGWLNHGLSTLLAGSSLCVFQPDIAAGKYPTSYEWLVTGLTAGATVAVDIAWGTNAGTATLYSTSITSTTAAGVAGGPVHLLAEAA